MTLGALRGESHRPTRYLSNRMPRTISTKPNYSIKWWERNNFVAPLRNIFTVLRELAKFRLNIDPPRRRGEVLHGAAREAGVKFPSLPASGETNNNLAAVPRYDRLR